MPPIGFSTGALALGDFQHALELLHGTDVAVVELSALRDHELPVLMAAVGDLDLEQFDYVSVHAPSRIAADVESETVDLLLPCIEREWPIIVHPDAITEFAPWQQFGPLLCLENMDKRKKTGRTGPELARFFSALPEASLCLDVAHARQIDTTLGVARFILAEFGRDRLRQVHLSELDARCHHARLSQGTVSAVSQIAHWIGDVPVILESRVTAPEIADELRMASLCFEPSVVPPSRLAWT